jgi:hypothetical protein
VSTKRTTLTKEELILIEHKRTMIARQTEHLRRRRRRTRTTLSSSTQRCG